MTLRIATVHLFVDDMAAARAFHGGGCTIAGPPERQPRGGMPMHVADPRQHRFARRGLTRYPVRPAGRTLN